MPIGFVARVAGVADEYCLVAAVADRGGWVPCVKQGEIVRPLPVAARDLMVRTSLARR